ncbi:MAG: energy transducer TonB [Timaviella obliquedivisa GSE-PSE-MK23-08B]|nr:energy transducer TonB [Timaviella obliquedivisa GSE-PSE-MK23-08B]
MSSSVRVKGLPLVFQRWMQEPAALSAIASLALHLPLLLLLPRLFSNAPGLEEPELPSPVDVVDLTAAEQGRVPDFQTPEIILPPLAQTPSSLSITPLPKASSPLSPTTLPPLPSFNTPSSSLWGFGSSFQFPPLGNTAPTFTVPQTQAPFIPYIPPRVTVQPPPRPPVQPTQTPGLTPGSVTSSPTPTPSPQPTATPGAAALGGESEPVAASPSPTVPTERSQAQINQELLARNQELRNKLTYNEAGTGDSDYVQAGQKWAESGQAWLGVDRPVTGSIQQGEINGSYPNVAGYRNLSGAVIVAVLVDENGKPAPDPTVLRSSGYAIFDEIALQDVMAQTFEATGKKEAYWIRVTYAPPGAA